MFRPSLEPFDYASVSPSVATFLKGQADRIRRGCATSIVQIGKALIEAKRHLSHGAFVHWVEGEVGIPPRTAQSYMRVARWVKGKNVTVAHLPPSLLYLLSAPSTPGPLASMLLGRAEAGERIDMAAARSAVRASRAARKGAHDPVPMKRRANCVAAAALIEVVSMLSRQLSEQDFDCVRKALTSDAVLKDPNLAANIVAAFAAADGPGIRWSSAGRTSVAA